MWEQLSTANPSLKHPKDIELFTKYQDHHQFMHFMMGLCEDFEPTQTSLLRWSPTLYLDAVVKELIFEKNHRPTYTSSPPPLPPIIAFTALL